jgi:hypothetical protein
VIIRNKGGEEVARVTVPEGGSVTVETMGRSINIATLILT